MKMTHSKTEKCSSWLSYEPSLQSLWTLGHGGPHTISGLAGSSVIGLWTTQRNIHHKQRHTQQAWLSCRRSGSHQGPATHWLYPLIESDNSSESPFSHLQNDVAVLGMSHRVLRRICDLTGPLSLALYFEHPSSSL